MNCSRRALLFFVDEQSKVESKEARRENETASNLPDELEMQSESRRRARQLSRQQIEIGRAQQQIMQSTEEMISGCQ